MDKESDIPIISIEPSKVMESSCDWGFFGQSATDGKRWVYTDGGTVEVFIGQDMVSSFSIENNPLRFDSKTLNIHPLKELVVISEEDGDARYEPNERAGIVTIYDFQGVEVHQFRMECDSWFEGPASGFDEDGHFFLAYKTPEQLMLAVWDKIQPIHEFGDLSKAVDKVEIVSGGSGVRILPSFVPGWSQLVVSDKGVDYYELRYRDKRLSIGGLIERNSATGVSCSIDRNEFITTCHTFLNYPEPPSLTIQKFSFNLENQQSSDGLFNYQLISEIPWPGYTTEIDSPSYFLPIDLVRVILTSFYNRMYILHTRSMVLEAELIIGDGYYSVDQIQRSGDYVVVKRGTQILWVEIKEILKLL